MKITSLEAVDCAATRWPSLARLNREVIALSSDRASPLLAPCLPSKAARPPSGRDWVHEIKHDGYRLLVRRDGARIRCFTRNGHDWADRFPAIVDAALRGIVSKRTDAPYRSGRSRTWLKSKNPESAAVRREREEEWR